MVTQEYVGHLTYTPDFEADGYRLLIAIDCTIGEQFRETKALLDVAAEWSVLPTTIANELGYDGDSQGFPMVLLTRFGKFEGVVVEIPLQLKTEAGETVSITAKWFVSDYWFGPTVLGWRGCLELLRTGLNPDESRFYFAPAEGIGAA